MLFFFSFDSSPAHTTSPHGAYVTRKTRGSQSFHSQSWNRPPPTILTLTAHDWPKFTRFSLFLHSCAVLDQTTKLPAMIRRKDAHGGEFCEAGATIAVFSKTHLLLIKPNINDSPGLYSIVPPKNITPL